MFCNICITVYFLNKEKNEKGLYFTHSILKEKFAPSFNTFFKNEFLQIITGGGGEGKEKMGEGGMEKYNHNTGGGGKGHISLCTFLI